MPGTEKQNNMFRPSTGYVQKNNPFPVTSCGRRRNDGSPLLISEASYNKQNRKMRKENPTMGSKLTSGTSPRRVSFACRFAGMKGPMKESNGEPTRKSKALKKWGFGSVDAASKFCSKNKKKK